MRRWGKAIRDDDKQKLDFEGFISPIVLVKYAQYMDKHRQTAAGLRDSDNWQSGFGEDHETVCMKSLIRHTMDAWLEHRGHESRDGMEDALCGILFNTMAILHQRTKKDDH